ncbi:MAG: cell division ATP-binding protein FtsE [Clostridia bacterium]|nr:cell division ATP-binding protein FtsE [Clostridia bacterium]
MILFDDVFKNYPNGTNALNGVSFEIQDGEFVFIIGPSGAGKSTMIKLLLREERHSSGKIIVNDFNLNKMKNGKIPMLRRSMGVVFQDFRLIETMTVYENVAFAMRVIGCSNKTIRRRVPYVLGIVGLGHKSKNYPKELSGGEQQRVALARALVNNPKTIIADEPTGNVDPALAREIMELLIEINKMGTTVIVITHDQKLVDEFNKRVIALKGGQIISDTTGGYEYNERG